MKSSEIDFDDELVQLNDGHWKWLTACDGDDLDSLNAWNKRRYARALATRTLVRDGKWDQLECDYLTASGEFCGRTGCTVQLAGPVGEPYAVCRAHCRSPIHIDGA